MSHETDAFTEKQKDALLAGATVAMGSILVGHLSALVLHPRAVLNIHPGIRFMTMMYQFSRTVGGAALRGGGAAALDWLHTSAAGRAYFNRVTMQGGARAALAKKMTPGKPSPVGMAKGTLAVASGVVLGAAFGIGISKAIWGESGERTAREFYAGLVLKPHYGTDDWLRDVMTIPGYYRHD